jgi:ATP-binding cassette subfamily B multidrug efflux pump
MLVLNVSTVAVLWFGAHRVDDGRHAGRRADGVHVLSHADPHVVMMATMMSMMIPRAAVSAERIMRGARHRVLGRHPPQAPVTRPGHARVGGLRPRRVPLPRRRTPVLQDISFEAARADDAIIGSTGAGKTTLINLMPRLFDVTGGTVRVGGVDVREAEPDVLWGGSAWCRRSRTSSPAPSPPTCATASPTPPTRSCGRRCEIAQAEDFVREMPDGLEAPIAQGGTNVSGGQRQRLAIARAWCAARHLPLRRRLLGARCRHRRPAAGGAGAGDREATVIVVAQRVSTIIDADQIIVLDDGRVVGRGRHTELLRVLSDLPGDRRVPARDAEEAGTR